MTIDEMKARLFPCIYRTRQGALIEITDFAFKGHFIGDEMSNDIEFMWDKQGNLFKGTILNTSDYRKFDLMELVKSPQMAGILKKIS